MPFVAARKHWLHIGVPRPVPIFILVTVSCARGSIPFRPQLFPLGGPEKLEGSIESCPSFLLRFHRSPRLLSSVHFFPALVFACVFRFAGLPWDVTPTVRSSPFVLPLTVLSFWPSTNVPSQPTRPLGKRATELDESFRTETSLGYSFSTGSTVSTVSSLPLIFRGGETRLQRRSSPLLPLARHCYTPTFTDIAPRVKRFRLAILSLVSGLYARWGKTPFSGGQTIPRFVHFRPVLHSRVIYETRKGFPACRAAGNKFTGD